MLSDELLLARVKKLVEARLGWGDSADWTNQDFLALSRRIREEIGVSVSHMTLKRIWGKVRYDSMPNNFTLSTLAQFAGYEHWRDFKVKEGMGDEVSRPVDEVSGLATGGSAQGADGETSRSTDEVSGPAGRSKRGGLWKLVLPVAAILGLATCGALFIRKEKKKIVPADYTFRARQVLPTGVPNSVIFDYDATRAPSDSVALQQSWDSTLRVKVSKDQHQHTLIYYMPGYFLARLLVGDQIAKEQGILVPSGGWMAAAGASPMPVYFERSAFIADGKMALSVDKIKAQHLFLSPQAPSLSYCNVQDFGELYTDHFTFETAVRNDYREGASVCQMTHIYLLCEGTAVGIPLCAKGCSSDIDLFFTGFKVSGKQQDLSAFGVDFSDFVKVRIEAVDGKARIFLNDRLAYTVDREITRARIIGVDLVFQGTGSVDYVRLANEAVRFDDEF